MRLRSFLFFSDEGTAERIRQVLASLDIEGESSSDAVAAVERIANQAFQIVIVDWDKQPEAGLLLSAARERKVAERAVTLAIVSDDASVPKALQAGANSILRKPISVSQAQETLKTARDLLRSRLEPSSPVVGRSGNLSAAAAPSLATIPASMKAGKEKPLRAGEFLQSGPASPGRSFVTESDVSATHDQPLETPVDQLKELEPVAASMAETKSEPDPLPSPGETRGLEWYLKTRGVARPIQHENPAPAAPPAKAKPELLGFDQSISPASPAPLSGFQKKQAPGDDREQKKEAELFAYLDTGADPEQTPRPGFRLGIRAIVAALILASCAIAAAPQAPWHPRMQKLWVRGQKGLHAWLNPQPVIPVQAPVAHENFARAGDEYKLPVTESIPDATTDPSQIRVLPVIDPTAKKPPVDNANPDQPAGTGDGSATAPNDQTPPPVVQTPDSQPGQTPAQNPPAQTPPVTVVPSPASSSPAALAPAATPKVIPQSMVSYPAPHRIQPQPATTTGHIPSSLKSQMASSTPEASGNKPVEAALPSIEPVSVAESMERSLLAEQPPIAYPPSAKGQQGTVILQVLIGRDGTVQDAKFMQGSLAFARIAIEGVKQWKFKPYLMNGRPASVQTLLTMTFKPAA